MPTPQEARLRIIFASIVLAVWVVSFLIDVINPNYDPHPSIQPLMLIVAGALFGEHALRTGLKRKNGSDE